MKDFSKVKYVIRNVNIVLGFAYSDGELGFAFECCF